MENVFDPGLIELVFVFGLALALGLWQLIDIQRTLAKTRAAAEADATKPRLNPPS